MQLQKHEKRTKPVATILVPPSVFVAAERPASEVCIGVNFLSANARAKVLSGARKRAMESPESVRYETALQLALMREFVAASICSPNDCDAMPEQIPSETHVFLRLTEGGTKWLFDEIQRVEVELSPTHTEASGNDVSALLQKLSDGDAEHLDQGQLSRLLRHLKAALSVLEE